MTSYGDAEVVVATMIDTMIKTNFATCFSTSKFHKPIA